MENIIVDATGAVVGRLAARVAKESLKGNVVNVINSEKCVITGRPEATLKSFHEKRTRGDPYHGPFYPRRADLIVKRIIRGMLPYKKPRGREALKRVKVYQGVPDEFKKSKSIKWQGLEPNPKVKTIGMGRLQELLGVKT